MAHPPPKPPVAAAPLSVAEQEAAQVESDTRIANVLEAKIDSWLSGQKVEVGALVTVPLPIAPVLTPGASHDLCGRYTGSGWQSATVKDGVLTLTPAGYVAPPS